MRIVITGATGFIGSALSKELLKRGHELTALVRDIEKARTMLPSPMEFYRWDANSQEFPDIALQNADAIIHLAGEPIVQRWTPERKARIRSSRVDSTLRMVWALRRSGARPKAFLCASAIGIYGAQNDGTIDENSVAGPDFLAQVCVDWEKATLDLDALGIRRVNVRTGVVLGRGGGALDSLLPIFQTFLGGPVGSGKQWISWIHLRDLIGAYIFALENPSIQGPINATAPNPETNEDFSRKLAKALDRPSWLKAPGFALKLVLGEMAGVLLTGQKVIPRRLLDAGFRFQYPELEAALEDLFREDRSTSLPSASA